MKIYFASKMKHAEKWRDFAIKNPHHHIVSRWPYLEPFVPAKPEFAVNFWDADFMDIDNCDAVAVYAEPEDNLRGALVEAGYAIARNKTVFVIGQHDDFGTWCHHKNVEFLPSLEHLAKIDGPIN